MNSNIYGDWFIYIYSYNFNIYLFTDQDPDLEADPGVVPGQKVVHDLKVQEVVVKAIQNPDQDLDRNKKECVILDQSHSKLWNNYLKRSSFIVVHAHETLILIRRYL